MPAFIVLVILGLIIQTISEIAIPFLVIVIIITAITIGIFIYVNNYFQGEEFIKIKNSIKENTKKCNEFNAHIESLKNTYANVGSKDYGAAKYYDESNYNFQRTYIPKLTNNSRTYNCSLSVCKNAKTQPFKYFCKYFNVKQDENTLEQFENLFNNFAATDQGMQLLKKERDAILNSINDKIPMIIFEFFKERLMKELGFNEFRFNYVYYPCYSFVYVSPGGNSTMRCDINFNTYNLERFIKYLSEIVNFRNSIIGQRALMTSALREKIKTRDNYTCKICGLSIKDEPNLLLEIDHIIPLSKGGITSENNLQTLCWKCNRKKSNKI